MYPRVLHGSSAVAELKHDPRGRAAGVRRCPPRLQCRGRIEAALKRMNRNTEWYGPPRLQCRGRIEALMTRSQRRIAPPVLHGSSAVAELKHGSEYNWQQIH